MNNELLRHTLSTIQYRFQKALKDADIEFGNFSAGNGSRTPIQIVNHMSHLIVYSRKFIHEHNDRLQISTEANLNTEVEQFNLELKELDNMMAKNKIEILITKKLLQGPFSDALTHIGQLAMLRRLYNSPIEKENFSIAPIQTGIE